MCVWINCVRKYASVNMLDYFLKENWTKVVLHVCNIHEWVMDPSGYTVGACSHEIPLPQDERKKPWIDQGSKAHDTLLRVVWDKTLLNNIKYIKNFR